MCVIYYVLLFPINDFGALPPRPTQNVNGRTSKELLDLARAIPGLIQAVRRNRRIRKLSLSMMISFFSQVEFFFGCFSYEYVFVSSFVSWRFLSPRSIRAPPGSVHLLTFDIRLPGDRSGNAKRGRFLSIDNCVKRLIFDRVLLGGFVLCICRQDSEKVRWKSVSGAL